MSDRPCAIVTGAGSGVGRATAILLAQAGYDVVLVARTRAKLQETAELAGTESRGGEMLVLPTDLTDADATRGIVDRVMEAFGRIDALANVAGVAPSLPIEQITPQVWQNCIDANLSYVVHLTAAAWPVFRKQKGGVIVNVSSIASIDPFPGFAIYAAAKIGLNMFTRCTAGEGEKIGVKAVAIAPGAIETPMLRAIFDEKKIPASRTLSPEQVAAAIRDCITGARAFENGETILMPSP